MELISAGVDVVLTSPHVSEWWYIRATVRIYSRRPVGTGRNWKELT
ncbi:MAG TPA: hypothetical protein P5184_09280 [Bacteroidales bacterium]|nr:hypothetical protein [Bacteroidales bacterium]